MGNQLVGIAPSQIFPVEHYLTELNDLEFDVNLGSTRFLKVARARSQEGLVVVKVFAIHDPTLPLATYKDKLEDIRNKLALSVNCLPFQKITLSDKSGLMFREYVKCSLYDRISTRPFLCSIEKRWIAFQVLYAVYQCHNLGVCHGDIKLENIMITSWNWVLLTDFAPIKPTYLPEDNPADFSYFFDTSRRRTCYIAPERFIKTLTSEASSQLLLPEDVYKRGDLVPSMDIFSTGCALTELFTEGQPPFDFSQLLAYRSGDYSPVKLLEKIDDENTRDLLRTMMEKDPNQRPSAEFILADQKGKLFPSYFHTFLQSYMLMLSSTPILSPDEKISRLSKDIKNVINHLCEYEEGVEGLVLITSLVTSCIRGLHHCSSKLQALESLMDLAEKASSETILDRIIPYIFCMVEDIEPRVRVSAVNTLTYCLGAVSQVPCSDANVFPEYILPNLANIYQDKSVLVRAAYASKVSELAEIALRFLEQSQLHPVVNMAEGNRPSYETELNTLTEMIQHTVERLLKDPDNLVRQTLLENGITRLCVFFGKQRAHDILLSHMVTFLNEREDKHLRGAFFDSIVGVASYVGWHGTIALLPLLQQGLSDPEEFVMVKAINALTSLTELGLISKLNTYDTLRDMVSYLVHPSLWVRQSVVGYVSAVARKLELIDVHCKVQSLIKPYLDSSLIQVDKEFLLLSALKPPIPRIVFDSVVKCNDIALFIETLKTRKTHREKLKIGHMPSLQETQKQPLSSLFRRLISEGMTEEVEEYLLTMSVDLTKIHERKNNLDIAAGKKLQMEGIVNLPALNVQTHSIILVNPVKTDAQRNRTKKLEPQYFPSNEDWRPSYGAEPQNIAVRKSESTSVSPSSNHSGSMMTSPMMDSAVHVVASPKEIDHSLQEKSFIQYRCAPCKSELRELVSRKQEQFAEACRGMGTAEWSLEQPIAWELRNIPPPGWRLRGLLVAHLHEHRSAVNRIVTIPESTCFASCSNDGWIKIWDCAKMEGKNVANKSVQSLHQLGGPLVGLAPCEGNMSLASASQNGLVFVARTAQGSSKMLVTQTRQLDPNEEGFAVDVGHFDSGSQSVVVYATLYGSLIGWDLRSPNIAWKMENDLKHGVITSFCVDSRHSWLTLGTNCGFHICWDLRFQLPLTIVQHPLGSRVRRLAKHPTESSWVLSAVQGNNEVSMWNMETGFRQVVLWASNTPPLSQSQASSNSVCGMYTGLADRGAPFLLTGGSDMRVRFWDLEAPTDSFIPITAANETIPQGCVTYSTRLVDGTNVVHELINKPTTRHASGTRAVGPEVDVPRPGPEQPAAGHQDWISDITMCQASQHFMVTGSRDGVIKVWK
ncbi:phosphoinositide 3-kinase regulatory subunit 4 [Cloeon dipterum]|uniref:phosphoinositide 3-kinase regulatory subunit 4 n=1 Tax=Cloeon dipterum TaxID=197152 RepID=UPI00321FA720